MFKKKEEIADATSLLSLLGGIEILGGYFCAGFYYVGDGRNSPTNQTPWEIAHLALGVSLAAARVIISD